MSRNLAIGQAVEIVCKDPTGQPDVVARLAQLGMRVSVGKGNWSLVACKTPHVVAERAYKVLARGANGALCSVFDESVYRVGVWRSERAESDHGGGFYFYWSEQDALAGLAGNTTFAAAWTEGVELVLCEVEVAGRTVEYGHGKHAASRLGTVTR